MGIDAPRSQLSRRQVLWAIAATPAMAALTSCDSSPAEPPPGGGELKIGRPYDINSLDPGRIAANTPNQELYVNSVYNRLVYVDPSAELKSELAEEFELSSDGTELTLRLRKGVQFHTGREFNAEDVEWNIIRLRDPAYEATPFYVQNSEAIIEIRKIDTHTVELVQAQQGRAVFSFLDQLYIADRETLEGPDAANQGVGTGPFAVEGWTPGQGIELFRFGNYWDGELPYLDTVDIMVAGDDQTLAAQFESGGVDFAEGLSLRDASRLADSLGGELILDPAPATLSFIANVQFPPLDDVRVRQAINYAINRERVAETATAGVGNPTSIVWPPAAPTYDEEQASRYGFDLDRARSLLDEAGVSGFELTVFIEESAAQMVPATEVVRADLAELGIVLKTQVMEAAAFSEMLRAGAPQGMIGVYFNYGPPEPALALNRSFFISPTRPDKPSMFETERYTALGITAADPTLDDEARYQAVRDATDIMLESSFIMPMAHLPANVVTAPNVRDVVFMESARIAQARIEPS